MIEDDRYGEFLFLVNNLLELIGEDVNREGLRDTPYRVAKAWDYWTKGYDVDIEKLLTTFRDGAENYDQMVSVCNIPFYSHCEHHLAPFFGNAIVSYIPQSNIVGLSKLNRVVDAFARRLQVQERFTNQIADAIFTHLQPLGVGVHIKARHLCMESRGICQQGHFTCTTALRGVIKDEDTPREEFLKLTQ